MTESRNWKNAIIRLPNTIKNSIEILNQTSLRVLMVVDSQETLIGTISDGDIRRGLINGRVFESDVKGVINTNPSVVSSSVQVDEVMKIMASTSIYQIPILDDMKKVIGIHLWDDLNKKIELGNRFIIMAGGKGTRLLPRTESIPKPMLQIGGKPILEHLIQKAKLEGFRHFILTIHHLGDVIERYFGDGSSFGVNISYLKEDSPLGTAGSLSLLNSVPDLPIIVTNGDVLADVLYRNILDFHTQNYASATMAVQPNQYLSPFGVVDTRGLEIVGFEEKPIMRFLINAGVYVLEPSALSVLTKGVPCDMPDLFSKLRAEGQKTIAYPIHESWIDIGSPDDYDKVSQRQP